MKLRNKKTGEIRELPDGFFCGDNLKKICEEWEDAPEEPKGIIDICLNTGFSGFWRVQIDYDNKEEAEKAVEKLKAWKRLKDKGFRFIGKTYETDKRFGSAFYKLDDDTYSEDIVDDLDLLFGGEE